MPTESPRGPRRVFLLGATGTIGRATVRALVARGHEVVCFVRRRAAQRPRRRRVAAAAAGTALRFGDVTDPAVAGARRLSRRALRRGGVVHGVAHRRAAAMPGRSTTRRTCTCSRRRSAAGVTQFVLLSAICVQKPLLAFQQAKLAFEKALIESGLTYSIVRPTAFFKSLSGQVERVRQGKPFLVFGDGTLTACKPISDDDLAELPRRLPRRPVAAQPHPADRRAGEAHHAAAAGRAAVRAARASRRGSRTCRWRCSMIIAGTLGVARHG